MSAQQLLDQLLRQGSSMLRQPGFGPGAAAGGLLGLLLGGGRGRSFGGKAIKYGSVAAIGALAFRAYNEWQQRQAAGQARPAPLAGGMPGAAAPVLALPAPDESASRALIVAMIAAAKADGHLDDRERGLIEAELQRSDSDPAIRQWLDGEIRRPLDPAQVAAEASTPELAAQMYVASLLVADETSFMERAYLDELARQLKLPEGLKAELESQASAG